MRVLFLSFYFRPDLSAGSFRATALVDELARQMGPQDEVRVLTTLPNRYSSFDEEAPRHESSGNVTIDRLPVPAHQSGMLDQAWSYATYASRVLFRVLAERDEYDMVFATSARLMTAALGAVAASALRAPLYLDIRDLFVENLSELFSGRPQIIVVPFLRVLEKVTVRSASRVNLVSPGFVEYFEGLRRDLDYRTFTNGIDPEFLDVDYHPNEKYEEDPSVILYAGNIGEGQGLEDIIPGAAEALAPDYEFWVVGDGGRRSELEERVAGRSLSNVRVMDPVPREELIGLYRCADVLFLHLNDYDVFRYVLPSKVFEYAASGKPLLAGVDGYCKEFVLRHIRNAAVFKPCNVHGLRRALAELDFTIEPRPEFVERFARPDIARRMVRDILELPSP